MAKAFQSYEADEGTKFLYKDAIRQGSKEEKEQ